MKKYEELKNNNSKRSNIIYNKALQQLCIKTEEKGVNFNLVILIIN